jgi:uncharacterized SAM-binding protein YcdF (DUF218 family)
MKRFSIVLANLMSERGELNAETAARVDLAAQIERNEGSTLILLCGWPYRSDSDIAIADAMREYLLARHPSFSQKTRCQRLSRDTVGDAVFSRIYLGNLIGGLSTCLVNVVTSDYHVDRTKEIFEFVFGPTCSVSVSGAPGFQHEESAKREADSLAAFRNTFGDVLPGDLNSIYSALWNRHPFYNGQVYPRISRLDEVASALAGVASAQ